ncbi:MAG: carotenoid oxygenase family protein [Myxococcota bacterium]
MAGYDEGVHGWVEGERPRVKLDVRGTLPDGLRGTFARNSSNPAFPPPGRFHWFDGDGMVHAVTIDADGAAYLNRYVRTRAFEREREAGHALWGGILNPMAPKGEPPVKDTANTHLVAYRDHLLATWWLSGQPLELDPIDLSTRPAPPFFAALGGRTVAAHPKVDPRTGELLFFGFQMHKSPWYWVGIADRDGNLVRTQEIDTAGPRIPHDIGITPRYVVVLDLPLGWDPAALAAGKRKIGFDRSAPARFGLWPRGGGAVRWFDVPPCYVYHLTSSYEDGDDVVVTGCRIDDPIPDVPVDGVPRLDTIHLRPLATRWRLRWDGGVSVEDLDDVPSEFPRVNDATWGARARFAYHPRIDPRSEVLAFDGFRKLDHDGGPAATCAYPPGWRGGEVVFAPRPGGVDEDDGWVLTMLAHPDAPHAELWVVDARAVDQGPVAVLTVPHRVPLGFHAEWIAR